MSFIYRNSLSIPLHELTMSNAIYNNFKNYWPTTTMIGSDGRTVDVFSHIRVFYHNSFIDDEVTKKFLKSIGIKWEDFSNQRVDGEIESMYFKFKGTYIWDGRGAYNQSYTSFPSVFDRVAPTKAEIADFINSDIPLDSIVICGVNYGGGLERYIANNPSNPWYIENTNSSGIPSIDVKKDVIRDTMDSNPWYYYFNSRHIPYTEGSIVHYADVTLAPSYMPIKPKHDKPVCLTSSNFEYGIFALLGFDDAFEFIKVDNENLTTAVVGNDAVIRYEYKYYYKFKGVTENSPIVNDILRFYNMFYPDKTKIDYDSSTKEYRDAVVTSTLDTPVKTILLGMMNMPAGDLNAYNIVESNLYIQNSDGHYFLKKEAFDIMKKKEFVRLISDDLDTGYSIEAKAWWEEYLYYALIIATLVVAFFTSGISAGIGPGVIATFASVAAVGFSLTGLIVSKVGGLSSNGNATSVGKIAQVMGYIALAAGLYNIIQKGFEIALAEAQSEAAQEAYANALSKGVTDEAITNAVNEAVENVSVSLYDAVIAGFSDVIGGSVWRGISVVGNYLNTALSFFYAEEDRKMQRELNEKQEELEKLEREHKDEEDFSFIDVKANMMLTLEKLSMPDMLDELWNDFQNTIGTSDKFDNKIRFDTRYNNS